MAVYVARFQVLAYGTQSNSPNRPSVNPPVLYSKSSKLHPSSLSIKKANLTNSQDNARSSNSIVEATAECTSTLHSTNPRLKPGNQESPNYPTASSQSIDWNGNLNRKDSQQDLLPSFVEKNINDTAFFSLANDKDLSYESRLSSHPKSPANSDLIFTLPLSDVEEKEISLDMSSFSVSNARLRSKRWRKGKKHVGNLMNFLKESAESNSQNSDLENNHADDGLKRKTSNREIKREKSAVLVSETKKTTILDSSNSEFPKFNASDYSKDQIDRLERSFKGSKENSRSRNDGTRINCLLDPQLISVLGIPNSKDVNQYGFDFEVDSQLNTNNEIEEIKEKRRVNHQSHDTEVEEKQEEDQLSANPASTDRYEAPELSNNGTILSSNFVIKKKNADSVVNLKRPSASLAVNMKPSLTNTVLVKRFSKEKSNAVGNGLTEDVEEKKNGNGAANGKKYDMTVPFHLVNVNDFFTKQHSNSKATPLVDSSKILSEKLSKVRSMMCNKSKNGQLNARRMLQELSSTYVNHPRVLEHWAQLEIKCGNVCVARKRFMESVELYEKAKNFDSNYLSTLNSWASMESSEGNLSQARSLYFKAISNGETNQENRARKFSNPTVISLHSWAMSELKAGFWENARKLLQEAESIQPFNAIVLQSRALMEAKVHNYSIARNYFRRACEAAPEDPACFQARAIFEAEQGRTTKMRSLFSKASEISPTNIYVLQAWAYQESLLETPESLNRAKDLYRKCTEISPNSIHAWQAWGTLELKMKNFTAAKQLLETCIHIAPRSVPSLQVYARLEIECGNLHSAKELISVALKLQPKNAAVLMVAAKIEQLSGFENSAHELYIQAAMVDKAKAKKKRRMFVQRKKTFQLGSADQDLPQKKKNLDVNGAFKASVPTVESPPSSPSSHSSQTENGSIASSTHAAVDADSDSPVPSQSSGI